MTHYLEGRMDFSRTSLTPSQRQRAESLLQELTAFYGLNRVPQTRYSYKPTVLIRETYERVESKDEFLQSFSLGVFCEYNSSSSSNSSNPDLGHALSVLSGFNNWELAGKRKLREALERFASTLVSEFFLPRKSQ